MGREILFLPPPPYDFKITYGPDPEFHFGYLRVPRSKGPHPVAIVIHGGFWRAAFDLEHSGHLCAALTKAGIATWSLEYRRIGNPGGGFPGTCEDILLGASFLPSIAEQHNLNPTRAVVIGHSAEPGCTPAITSFFIAGACASAGPGGAAGRHRVRVLSCGASPR